MSKFERTTKPEDRKSSSRGLPPSAFTRRNSLPLFRPARGFAAPRCPSRPTRLRLRFCAPPLTISCAPIRASTGFGFGSTHTPCTWAARNQAVSFANGAKRTPHSSRHRAVKTPPSPAFGLKVHERMAGMFLAFPCFGEKAMHVVSACGGQFILDAPETLSPPFPQFNGHDRWRCRAALLQPSRGRGRFSNRLPLW